MDRIRPPMMRSVRIVRGQVQHFVGFNEIGMCASIVAEVNNRQINLKDMAIAGMFFKNKDSSVTEAEICRGTGCNDYPLLVPIKLLAEKATNEKTCMVAPTV